MIYNKKYIYIWSVSPVPGISALKFPRNFLSDKSKEGERVSTKPLSTTVELTVEEMTSGKPLRMEAGCQENQLLIRGLELSIPPLDLWGQERDWRLN